MDDFRTHYNLGTLNFDDLEYQKACSSDAVLGVLGALGGINWSGNTFFVGPVGAALRVAEGIDAVRNLFASGMALSTEVERGAVIVCGLSQLGGLIFSILALVVAMILCVCAPVGSAIALFLYRFLAQTEEAAQMRNKKIDRLIKRQRRSRPQVVRLSDKTVVPVEKEQLLPISS